MVADERTSLPTGSRQKDQFEFVVAPVTEVLVVAVVGVKVMLFIFSLIINDYELVEMFEITK